MHFICFDMGDFLQRGGFFGDQKFYGGKFMLINFKVIWANHEIFRKSGPRVASSFCVRISRLGINGVSWRVFIEFFSDQWVINERLDIDAMTLTGDGGVGTGNESPVILEVSPNSTYCLTTRHARDVLCCGCWAARRDTLVTTSATRTTRVQGRGLGWTCPPHFFQKLFLRLMQMQSTKD